MDWNAMPSTPSGGKVLVSKCGEYRVAAPSVCPNAFDEECEHVPEKKDGTTYSLSSDADIVSIFLTVHGGAIAIRNTELLPGVHRGRASRRVIERVPVTGWTAA
jgi:hypothetical protein